MTIQMETIRREFPAVDLGDATVIDACCLHHVAARNVRDILRSCPEGHLGQGGGIVADEILHHCPDVRDAMEDTPDTFDYWNYHYGFSEARTRALQAALSAIGERTLETVIRELAEIAPWIACMAEMDINPTVRDWSDCVVQSERWQRMVRDFQCDRTAAEFWGAHEELHGWNALSGAVVMDGLAIAPILEQAEFATECARHDPGLYPRYVNLCISNRARPFVVCDEASGATVALCVLRADRGTWVLSEPSYMRAGPAVIDTLQKFASRYRCNVNGSRPNAHLSWPETPVERADAAMSAGALEANWGAHRMAA